MTDELKNQINELKADIADCPKDQKGSFVMGVTQGLCLGVSLAKVAGYDTTKDKELAELLDFLCRDCPPMKTRNKATQKPKPARDQLADDIKELLRRAIAARLRIRKDTFDSSLDAEEVVNKYFLIVVAIANRSALDDAIQDIRIMRSIAGGGEVDRECVRAEVEFCYEKFRIEIAGMEHFNELSKRSNFEMKNIWIYLRANVPVSFGYDDDELRQIDARYQLEP